MESESGKSRSGQFDDPSCSSNGSSNHFECNICFEMAEDPILTLCGHLYCWPCLYKWLHFNACSHRCPVCNAVVEEEKLVPIYGRGKDSSKSRPQSIPSTDIPRRPVGQRPETAPPPARGANQFPPQGSRLMGGFFPMEAVRIGSLTLSAAIGSIFPAVFPFFPAMMNFQVHGFNDATVYGTTSGFPYGIYNSLHGGHDRGFGETASRGQQLDSSLLKIWFLLIGLLVIFYLIC